MNKALLKDVLSVPTCFRDTRRMVDFLHNWCLANGVRFYSDHLGNTYATKGNTSGFYPAVCAHIDSVHPVQPFRVVEDEGVLFALDEHNGQCGLGGDDKAGVFVCLELLTALPVLKAAFFVDEEIGCLGSKQADPMFFEDVGYCIEFDSPNNDILSFSCDGVQLCDESGEFLRAAEPILSKFGAVKWQYHPFTDVAQIRRKFKIECLNLPCGYYNMHSSDEHVVIGDTERAIELGKSLIGSLGYRRYHMPLDEGRVQAKRLSVTGLVLD